MGFMRTEELPLAIFFQKTEVATKFYRKERLHDFFKQKLSPSIIAHFPHVWSNQYWGTPNGVIQ